MRLIKFLPLYLSSILLGSVIRLHAGAATLTAPDGELAVTISDQGGLHYGVTVNSKPVLTGSPLGLEFQDGTRLGPTATITKTKTARHDGVWENHFGKRLKVRDHWKELRLTVREQNRTFGLVARA